MAGSGGKREKKWHRTTPSLVQVPVETARSKKEGGALVQEIKQEIPSPNLSQCQTNRTSIKIGLFGQCSTGKTPLVLRYVTGHFPMWEPTIEDTYKKEVQIGKKMLILDILDTSGSEDFALLRGRWIKNCDAFMVVFSCTCQNSIDEINGRIEQIERFRDCDSKDIPMVLVGNKSDLESEYDFSLAEVTKLAQRKHCPLIFTSALLNINVTQAFEQLVKTILEHDKHPT